MSLSRSPKRSGRASRSLSLLTAPEGTGRLLVASVRWWKPAAPLPGGKPGRCHYAKLTDLAFDPSPTTPNRTAWRAPLSAHRCQARCLVRSSVPKAPGRNRTCVAALQERCHATWRQGLDEAEPRLPPGLFSNGSVVKEHPTTLVGVETVGFEPTTLCLQGRRSPGLSYIPIMFTA